MKKQGKMPITGATRTQMRPKPPVKTDERTSVGAEKQIKQPPMPFANKQDIKNLPVGVDLTNSKAGPTNKVGVKALPKLAAVGQNRPINQSAQIGGRMGYPPPRRKAGSQNLGKAKRGAAFYGE